MTLTYILYGLGLCYTVQPSDNDVKQCWPGSVYSCIFSMEQYPLTKLWPLHLQFSSCIQLHIPCVNKFVKIDDDVFVDDALSGVTGDRTVLLLPGTDKHIVIPAHPKTFILPRYMWFII